MPRTPRKSRRKKLDPKGDKYAHLAADSQEEREALNGRWERRQATGPVLPMLDEPTVAVSVDVP